MNSCRSRGHEPSSLGYLGEKPCINPVFLHQLTAHHGTHFLDLWCFSHDHFHCQLRTCMFWSQTCNEKADGLEICHQMSCSGCLGPLCEEMNHLSVANPIASHIWWSAAYYIYMCISLSTPPVCWTYCSLKRWVTALLKLCFFCSVISLIRRRVGYLKALFLPNGMCCHWQF